MIRTILEQALALPAEERAALAMELFHSLDPTADDEFGTRTEEQWHIEVAARIASIKCGECIPVDWQIAMEEDRRKVANGDLD